MDGKNPAMLNPFSGTHAIVIEYDDIIRSPMLTVMEANKHNYKLSGLVDLRPLKFVYKYGMFEWYLNRHHRNPLQELTPIDPSYPVDDDAAYDIMKTFLHSDSHYVSESRPLVFCEPLRVIMAQKFNMEYFVYNEYGNPYIADDMAASFPGVAFKIITGPFAEAIADVPFDATWVLSDIRKMNDLDKAGKLNLSNIMVAGDYRYNFTDEDREKPIVDVEELRNKSVFKFKMFRSAALTEAEQLHLSHLLSEN